MTRFIRNAALAAAALVALSTPVLADGNLAAKGTDLELKIDTANLKFSQTEFDLETGKYYKLTISSDGNDEISVVAPELFQNSFIDGVEDDDFELHTTVINSIEFDDEGEVEISFVPIRPGEYTIYAPGFENRGLTAKVVVK
jgi:hypothetical protein